MAGVYVCDCLATWGDVSAPVQVVRLLPTPEMEREKVKITCVQRI